MNKLFKGFINKEINLKEISGAETTCGKYWEHLNLKDDYITFGGKKLKKNHSVLCAPWIGSESTDLLPVDGSCIQGDVGDLISYGANVLLDTNNRIQDIELFSETGGGCCISPHVEVVNNTPDLFLEDFCDKLDEILKVDVEKIDKKLKGGVKKIVVV